MKGKADSIKLSNQAKQEVNNSSAFEGSVTICVWVTYRTIEEADTSYQKVYLGSFLILKTGWPSTVKSNPSVANGACIT